MFLGRWSSLVVGRIQMRSIAYYNILDIFKKSWSDNKFAAIHATNIQQNLWQISSKHAQICNTTHSKYPTKLAVTF
jgi:hypothetical protein